MENETSSRSNRNLNDGYHYQKIGKRYHKISDLNAFEGLPIGMQFVADYGHDKKLIELAFELEAAKPWKTLYQA